MTAAQTSAALDAAETRSQRPERGGVIALVLLIGLGTLFELLCIYGVAQPLSLLTYSFPIAASEPVSAILGLDLEGLRSFLVVASAAIALYLASVIVSRRCRGGQALVVILAFSALFSVTLLFAYPAGARDVFTNIMDGRMRWLYGFNPMVSAPRVVSFDPLFKAMTYWQDEPSYYGPLWYLLLFFPTRVVGTGLVENLIAFRALTIPFLLGSAFVAARIVARRDPALAPVAALIVGWSPLVLWESAANGHNDIVMVFFALVAVDQALHRRWTLALPLLALSILVKYVTVLLLPLFLIAALRDGGRRALRACAAGVGLSLWAGLLALAPFWSGPATFSALITNGANRFNASPATVLAALIDGNQALAYYTSPTAGHDAKLITLALFALAYAIVALRLLRGNSSLLSACFYSLLLYLLLVSWWFWPWYVTWPLALGAALVGRRPLRLALLFSVLALYSYAIFAWRVLLFNFRTNLPFHAAIVLLVFAPVAGVWASALGQCAWVAALAEGRLPSLPALDRLLRVARPGRLAYTRNKSIAEPRYDPATERPAGQRPADAGATVYPGGGGAD